MKLKPKVFLMFLLSSIIPVLIIMISIYYEYANTSRNNMNELYHAITLSAEKDANQSISEINHILEMFALYNSSDDSLIQDLKKYTSKENYTAADVFRSNNNLKFISQNLIYSTENINGIFIFTPSGQSLGYGSNISIMPNYEPFSDDWYKKTLSLEGKTYVSPVSIKNFFINSKPSISFSKALYDVYTHEFLGVLFVDYSPKIFDLSTVNTLPESVLLTVETSESYILYSNVNQLQQPLPANPEQTTISKVELDIDGLILTSSVNPSVLYHNYNSTRWIILLLGAIYVLLFILISALLSRFLTRPIIYLSGKMSNHKLDGYVTNERYLNRSDEIGTLFNEYNTMLEEQEKHIKDQYQNKLITLDAQMKSLEAQINSHFLYNTLESINSLAEIEGIESISIMSMALGNMFRYSIKAKSELVTVKEELSNVEDYVSIQKIRFKDKFQLILDIPIEMYRCHILKLIFQPLVENALLHGLDRCGYGDTITIHGKMEQDNLIFQISDNGMGMNDEQLETIRKTLEEPPHFKELGRRSTQSIGLKNIASRIELYYGVGYGLTVDSTKGTGTTISIKLPYIEQERI